MGRYDRIRVWNGSSWRQPSMINVWNGSRYVTLGANDSYNTQHIYANAGGGNYRRATLYRHDYSIPGESYSYGTMSLSPGSNCGWNPHSATSADHYFECTIRKTTNGAVTIFDSGNSAGTCRLRIVWEADGRISMYTRSVYYSSGNKPTTTYTSNAVGANQWATLKIYAAKSTSNSGYNYTITWNGVKTNGTSYNTWAISGASNTVGSSGLEWSGWLDVQLARYDAGVTRVSTWAVNMKTGQAGVGSISRNMSVTNTSSTGTEWI